MKTTEQRLTDLEARVVELETFRKEVAIKEATSWIDARIFYLQNVISEYESGESSPNPALLDQLRGVCCSLQSLKQQRLKDIDSMVKNLYL